MFKLIAYVIRHTCISSVSFVNSNEILTFHRIAFFYFIIATNSSPTLALEFYKSQQCIMRTIPVKQNQVMSTWPNCRIE